jgi:hypothetical protein
VKYNDLTTDFTMECINTGQNIALINLDPRLATDICKKYHLLFQKDRIADIN